MNPLFALLQSIGAIHPDATDPTAGPVAAGPPLVTPGGQVVPPVLSQSTPGQAGWFPQQPPQSQPKPAPTLPPPVSDPSNDIILTAKSSATGQTEGPDAIATSGPKPADLGNKAYIKAVGDNEKQLPPHEGLFHIKGTLRDILGGLSDALLVQSGHSPVYAPFREQEKLQDAMTGLTTNPMAAIERISQQDPKLAATMYNQQQENAARMANAQSLAQNRASLGDYRQNKNSAFFLNRFARMLEGAKTPEERAAAISLGQRQAAMMGVDLSSLGELTSLTPEEQNVIASGDMTVQQQRMLPLAKQNADAHTESAQAATINANRPRPGRAEPQQGLSNVDAIVANAVLSGKATPEQQQYYNDRIKHQSKETALQTLERLSNAGKTAAPSHGFKEGQTIYKGNQAYVVRGGKAYPKQ